MAQPGKLLFRASVCQAEILAGIAVMPHGRRRESLETAARTMFEDDFAGRVLPFDHEAAVAYGDLFAARRRVGRPGSTAGSDDRVDRSHKSRQCRHARYWRF
jgi:toxin FitB